MNRPYLSALALLLMFGCRPVSDLQTPNGGPPLFVGAASTTVSPAPGAFIAGDARNRRFAGEHDPLFARAVVMSQGDTAVAIVTVDNIGLTFPDIVAMRELAASTLADPALPAHRIVISSTHTHSGPDVVGLWGEHALSSGRDEAYMVDLRSAVAEQIVAAARNRVAASARVAEGRHNFPWVENVTEPALLDRTVTTIELVDRSGSTIATLTNFACHPTVMDAVSDQISSDYVAGFYRTMGAARSGEHLFLQGAIGGWVQPDKTGRSFELADGYGSDVAAMALELLEGAEPMRDTRIRFAARRFDIPLENPGFIDLLDAGVLNRPLYDGSVRTEAVWFTLGPVAFVSHPGETSPSHSLTTRRLFDAKHTFVMGLTQDALGYILKPAYFEPDAPFPSADYLTATSVGPQAAPRLMDALRALAKEAD